jgi:hypothetical protein
MMLAQPQKITSFSAVIERANAHARNIVESKKAGVPSDIAVPAPVPVMNGGPRSAAEERLAGLLKRQAELAEDPAREAEYRDVVAALTQAQDEVTAEQQIGAQQHG